MCLDFTLLINLVEDYCILNTNIRVNWSCTVRLKQEEGGLLRVLESIKHRSKLLIGKENKCIFRVCDLKPINLKKWKENSKNERG